MGKNRLKKLYNRLSEKYNITLEELNQCLEQSKKLGLQIEDYLKSKQEKVQDKRKEVLTKYNYHNNFISFDDFTTKQFCIDFVSSDWFFLKKTIKQVEKDHNQAIKNFLSIEKHLNNQLYWILFGFLYIEFDVISKSLKEKLRETATKDRLSISLEHRSKLCFMFSFIKSFSTQVNDIKESDLTKEVLERSILEINEKNYDKQQNKKYFPSKFTLIKRLSRYLTRKNKQGIKTIKLYRGFSFNKKKHGKVIDKSKTYNNQIVGEGMSYTFDKNVSIFFSLKHHMFGELVKDVFGIIESFIKIKQKVKLSPNQKENLKIFTDFVDNPKEIRDKMYNENKIIVILKNLLLEKKSHYYRKSFLHEYSFERTGYYGVYEIKIDDILFISNRYYEKEIVTLNYKLLQYKIVDFELIKKWWLDWGSKYYGNQHDYS